jgi:uncharacterized protein with PhoU and TrkA domain
MVVGIRRPGGEYVGVPGRNTTVFPGDTLIVYGREGCIAELDKRSLGPLGDARHAQSSQPAGT